MSKLGEPRLICFNTGTQDVKLTLICFAHAGGGVASFAQWISFLPETIRLCAVQLPGRENLLRETAYTQLNGLIPALLQCLEQELGGNFAFWGHSMGALLSFEISRTLRSQHRKMPQALFVSGYPAPHLPYLKTKPSKLTDTELIDYIKKLGGTPNEILQRTELMTLLLPAVRSDFQIVESYIYQDEAPLPCPIYCSGGKGDQSVDENSLMQWHIHTSETFHLKLFEGSHFYFVKAKEDLISWLVNKL